MSIVALADGSQSSVTRDVLQDVAAKNNINIKSKSDEDAYLVVLQSADATSAHVDQLPDYVDLRLLPIPTIGGERKWSKPNNKFHNAWSHQTSLEAETATSTLLKGQRVVIKDNMSVAGLPYTCGMFPQFTSKTGQYPISTIDATVVRRLLEAGAIILGTSTCENYSLTPLSYTSANGPVHNPWLSNYNAGGSSSGSAYLLALKNASEAGVPELEKVDQHIDIAMGGDQAGSIRLPCSYCGIYGLKATHGLIPYTGIAGLHPMIDYAGPMARNLEDIAAMLTILAGYDGLDPRMTPESPLRQNVRQYHEELRTVGRESDVAKKLRVGIISESLSSPGTSPEVAKVVQKAATKCLSAGGALVEEVSVPMHLLGPAIWAAATRPRMAGLTVEGRVPDLLTHSLPHFVPHWPPDQDWFDVMTVANPAVVNVLFGETFLTEKYGPEAQAKAHRHVIQLRAAYDQALELYDVLITPTTPTVAPPMPDLRPEAEGGSTLMDKMKLAVAQTNNTCPFNASGHPALSIPCGWASASRGDGMLPVGMQIIGRKWDETTVLKAARLFELGGGGLGVWPGAT